MYLESLSKFSTSANTSFVLEGDLFVGDEATVLVEGKMERKQKGRMVVSKLNDRVKVNGKRIMKEGENKRRKLTEGKVASSFYDCDSLPLQLFNGSIVRIRRKKEEGGDGKNTISCTHSLEVFADAVLIVDEGVEISFLHTLKFHAGSFFVLEKSSTVHFLANRMDFDGWLHVGEDVHMNTGREEKNKEEEEINVFVNGEVVLDNHNSWIFHANTILTIETKGKKERKKERKKINFYRFFVYRRKRKLDGISKKIFFSESR